MPLPTLPSARSVEEAAPKLYAPPALLDPVPTTYCPSAAGPVPVSVRYQPGGRAKEGEVLLLSVLKVSEIPTGEVIETAPLPDDPEARRLAPSANSETTAPNARIGVMCRTSRDPFREPRQ